MPFDYHIYPLGDHAITIELGNSIDPALNQQCLDLAALLAQKDIPGIKDIVPAYCTVSVVYDPVAVARSSNIRSPYQYISERTAATIKEYRGKETVEPRKMVIPACFHESFAPDLALMAAQKRMTPGDIVQIFLNKTYRVYMIGFLPGFPYMGKVDDAIASPRKEQPHVKVEPGSIGIAGNQAGIYPLTSPGGWNIIGRMPLRLFDKNAKDPCLFRAGDEVTFRDIGIEEFHHLNQHA